VSDFIILDHIPSQPSEEQDWLSDT